MITGYITRGTTIGGKAVDEGTVHEMDEDTFRLLKLSGSVREHVAEAPAQPVSPVAETELKPSKKKAKQYVP